MEAEGVFVVDFDERDGGFHSIGIAGVFVDVREEVAGVGFLQRDHGGVVVVHAFVELGAAFFVRFGQVGVGAADVEVEVCVDAVFFERGDEVVELVELPGVEGAAVFFKNAGRCAEHVHVVEADAINAELGEARGDFVGVLVLWEVRGEAHVHAEDAQALFAGKQVAVFDVHEAVAACGFVVQPGDVGDGGRGVVPRELKGKHVGGRCGGCEREKDGKFHAADVNGAGDARRCEVLP